MSGPTFPPRRSCVGANRRVGTHRLDVAAQVEIKSKIEAKSKAVYQSLDSSA
jgi:hypothetical protein